MPISVRPGLPAKADTSGGKGLESLPSRQALAKIAAGKKTINDYAKAGRPINGYPPQNS